MHWNQIYGMEKKQPAFVTSLISHSNFMFHFTKAIHREASIEKLYNEQLIDPRNTISNESWSASYQHSWNDKNSQIDWKFQSREEILCFPKFMQIEFFEKRKKKEKIEKRQQHFFKTQIYGIS